VLIKIFALKLSLPKNLTVYTTPQENINCTETNIQHSKYN